MEISLKQMIDKGEAILQAREREEQHKKDAEARAYRAKLAEQVEKFLALVPEPLRWHVRPQEMLGRGYAVEVLECAPIWAFADRDFTSIESILVSKPVNYGDCEPYFSENNWDLVQVESFEEALGLARRFYAVYAGMRDEYQEKIRKNAELSKREEKERLYGMQVDFEAGHDPQVQLDEAVNCIITATDSDDLIVSQTEAQIGIGRILVSIHHQLKRIADAAEAENERMQLEIGRRELLHEYGSHGS